MTREKRCPKCGVTKPVEEFSRHRGRSDGRQAWCATCMYEWKKEYGKLNALAQAIAHRKHRYGLLEEDYNSLVLAQKGLCLVCEQSAPLHVDHDHETGAVRGLLCHRCNTGLGFFRDDPQLLQRAARYLSERKREAA